MYTSASELRWALLTEAMERLGPGMDPKYVAPGRDPVAPGSCASGPAGRSAWSWPTMSSKPRNISVTGDATAAALHARYFLARTRQLPERRQWCREILRELAEQLNSDQWLYEAYIAF